MFNKHKGFHDIVASEFFEQAANFDYTSKSIKSCYLFKQFTVLTCNNMTKTILFTLQVFIFLFYFHCILCYISIVCMYV